MEEEGGLLKGQDETVKQKEKASETHVGVANGTPELEDDPELNALLDSKS